MPRSLASLLIDSVSAIRNGLTSFSGDENPTTASFMLRSGGLTLQTSPLACATSCWAFSPPPPEPCPSVCAPGGAHAAPMPHATPPAAPTSAKLTTAAANRLTILANFILFPFSSLCCLTAYATANRGSTYLLQSICFNVNRV